jgi:hypothetical protein
MRQQGLPFGFIPGPCGERATPSKGERYGPATPGTKNGTIMIFH